MSGVLCWRLSQGLALLLWWHVTQRKRAPPLRLAVEATWVVAAVAALCTAFQVKVCLTLQSPIIEGRQWKQATTANYLEQTKEEEEEERGPPPPTRTTTRTAATKTTIEVRQLSFLTFDGGRAERSGCLSPVSLAAVPFQPSNMMPRLRVILCVYVSLGVQT